MLWVATRAGSRAACVIVRGCAGIDLQIEEGDVRFREQHPDSSTAYERARQLRAQFERDGYVVE